LVKKRYLGGLFGGVASGGSIKERESASSEYFWQPTSGAREMHGWDRGKTCIDIGTNNFPV